MLKKDTKATYVWLIWSTKKNNIDPGLIIQGRFYFLETGDRKQETGKVQKQEDRLMPILSLLILHCKLFIDCPSGQS